MSAAQDLPREERLRSTAGLRGTPALPLSAWRGESGRRYVVGVHDARDVEVDELAEAVAIGVSRDSNGIAQMQGVAVGLGHGAGDRWLGEMRRKGCTEIHVHRLAENAAERLAIEIDLNPTKKGIRR